MVDGLISSIRDNIENAGVEDAKNKADLFK